MSYGLRTTYTAYVECDTVSAIDCRRGQGHAAMRATHRDLA
jgi:hypothetical protein